MADLVYYMMFTMLGLGLGEKGNLKGIVLITCDMTEFVCKCVLALLMLEMILFGF